MVNYQVREISPKDTHEYLLNIHYAKRVPPIKFAYGLFEEEELVGVVTFAPPASPQIARGWVGSENRHLLLELNRLCLKNNKKNEASFLVSRAMKLLPRPLVVVSYADSAQGHKGYIYRACNFMYFGTATSHDSEYIVDGKKVHPRTLASWGITNPKQWARENNIEQVKPQPKHRYAYVIGSKKEKKQLKGIIKYEQRTTV